MWHCTRMGCCNKQRAVGARIAGLPQPSLRQRLSAFFRERLDFSAGIWIIAINAAFRRWFCGSIGGCPRNRHWEMASIKPFPKTAIPPHPLRNAKTTYGIPHAHNSIRNIHANARHMPCPHAITSDAKPSSIKAPDIGNPVEAPLCSGCNFRRARPMPHPFPSRHIAHYAEGAVQL